MMWSHMIWATNSPVHFLRIRTDGLGLGLGYGIRSMIHAATTIAFFDLVDESKILMI